MFSTTNERNALPVAIGLPAPLTLLLLLASAAGCSEEGELEGSLSEVYRLGHDDVRARLYESELSIEYTRNDGSVPVRVSLRVREAEPKAGKSYDLGEVGSITGQLADGTNIPPFIDGTLKLDDFKPNEGATVSGTFTGTFDGVRDTLGLDGDFDTTLEVISWPEIPEGVDPRGEPVADAGA